ASRSASRLSVPPMWISLRFHAVTLMLPATLDTWTCPLAVAATVLSSGVPAKAGSVAASSASSNPAETAKRFMLTLSRGFMARGLLWRFEAGRAARRQRAWLHSGTVDKAVAATRGCRGLHSAPAGCG